MIEQEEKVKDPYATMGTKEIRDKDGKTVNIYTTGKSADIDSVEAKKIDHGYELQSNLWRITPSALRDNSTRKL